MSRYADDERVTWPGGQQWLPPYVLALIPDPAETCGGRAVVAHGGGFAVEGALDKDLTLRDAWRQVWIFDTVDAAIAAVIGDPLTASENRAWAVLDSFDPGPQ